MSSSGGISTAPPAVSGGSASAGTAGSIGFLPFPSGDATGATDFANLTTVLNRAGTIRPNPLVAAGSVYYINGTLILPRGGGVDVDFGDFEYRLVAGSSCNMLNNWSLANSRTVIDAGITATQATLTSASATFTAGDVGAAVTIVGASTTGPRFFTTIQSVTNATTAVLASNAGVTVTNAWCTIGARDQNIVLRGGYWNRQGNGQGAFGYTASSIRLRRVDGLKCYDMEGGSTNGKYFLNPGDVWNFSVRGARGRILFSDTVHINGPARHGEIFDTYTDVAGDDVVSITCSDFNTEATMCDIAGNISDVTVNKAGCGLGSTRVVYVAAGTSVVGSLAMAASNISVNHTYGSPANSMVSVGGDPGDVNLQGGSYTGITVNGVKADTTASVNSAAVLLGLGTYDLITVNDIVGSPGMASLVAVGGSAVIDVATVTRLECKSLKWNPGANSVNAVFVQNSSIEHLIVNGAQIKTTSFTGTCLVRMATTESTNSNVTLMALSNFHLENASGGNTSAIVAAQNANATLTTVQIANAYCNNVTYPLGRWDIATRVKASNVTILAASAQIRVEQAVTVTVEQANVNSNTANVSLASSGVATFAPPGVLVSGTVTLVGGTLAVALAAITSAGKIRLFNIAGNGTVGALSCVIVGGTGFTINSSSAADISTIYYEVISY